jgi:hypothetical protein
MLNETRVRCNSTSTSSGHRAQKWIDSSQSSPEHHLDPEDPELYNKLAKDYVKVMKDIIKSGQDSAATGAEVNTAQGLRQGDEDIIMSGQDSAATGAEVYTENTRSSTPSCPSSAPQTSALTPWQRGS